MGLALGRGPWHISSFFLLFLTNIGREWHLRAKPGVRHPDLNV